MDTVRQKCRKLGIEDCVVFAGAQKDPAPYLSAMDVFIFPSLYEGLGSALIEAQANGLHVVTSADVVPGDIDVTGNASFVSLCAPPEVWARTILDNCRRADPEAAGKRVAEKYDIRAITEKLSSIYCDMEQE